jgi:hypothetical protein
VNTNAQKNIGQILYVLFFTLGFAITPAHIRAVTITVTNAADSGAGTLRAAVSSATNGDTVVFSLPTPSKISLASVIQMYNQSVNILGPGPTNLFVDGNSNGLGIFSIYNQSTNAVTVTIAGLTLTNGALPDSSSGLNGAAIYNESSTLTVSNCVFSGNSAGINLGGAIANVGRYYGNYPNYLGRPAHLYLINSIFENNSALEGGAVFNDGSSGCQSTPALATVVATNCTFRGNVAGFGGAIANGGFCGGGTSIVQVANCTFTGNTGGNAGGAIDNGTAKTGVSGIGTGAIQLEVSGSSLSGNAATYGGAVSSSGIMAVLNSTFVGNLATNGGAIYNVFAVAITNSTFSGNSATTEGGAVDNGYNDSCIIMNCTFKGDYAPPVGGGIRAYRANMQIGGTILNETGTANIYDYQHGYGVVTSLGYNLSSDNGAGYLTNATDQLNTDPLLGPLQDNGGPTFTHAPLPGSPAIDKGKNFSGSATDQRGLARTFDKAAIANAAGGDGTDIGAVESQSYTVVNTNDSGTGSLRQAIADSNAQPGTNTIDFAPSAYGTILLTSGELLITNNVFIAGPGPTNEAVDGNHASRVFNVSNTVATFAGMTITNGFAAGSGGGINSSNSTLTFSNCIVSGNVGGDGGGIFNWIVGAGSSALNIVNSIVSGNSGARGGGINNIAFGGTASVQVVNSTLSGNKATSNGGGGGIYSASGGGGSAIVQVVGSAISGNSANNNPSPSGPGGGIYIRSTGPGIGSLTVSNSAITSNLGYSAGGGIAIFCQVPGSTTTVAVVSSTLNSNSTPFGGGAIFSTSYDSSSGQGGNVSLQIANCTLSGNSAGAGTAIGNASHTGGGITRILNSTVCSNFNFSPFGTADSVDIGPNAKLEIGSTVLNGLGPNLGGSPGAMITSLGYNLGSDDGGGFLTNSTDQINTDPLLGPLQDNDGPTFTHAPRRGSPAIDKGKNFSGSATDQRGFARTLDIAGVPNAAGGDSTDIGAVESRIAWLNNPGVVSNHFGFDLIGPASNSIVVEVSSNVIGTWTALSTNILGSTALRFTDPAAPTSPQRFYRARVP